MSELTPNQQPAEALIDGFTRIGKKYNGRPGISENLLKDIATKMCQVFYPEFEDINQYVYLHTIKSFGFWHESKQAIVDLVNETLNPDLVASKVEESGAKRTIYSCKAFPSLPIYIDRLERDLPQGKQLISYVLVNDVKGDKYSTEALLAAGFQFAGET